MSPSHINADWSADGAASHGNAFHMVHRLLRGRYLVTLVAAALFAVVGGAVGFLSQKPLYRSESVIRIQSTVQKILYDTEQSAAPRMFSAIVESQAGLMQTSDTIERAMESDDWREIAMISGITTPDAFRARLRVKTSRSQQELIGITFEHENASVAHAGNRAIIEAYMELHGHAQRKEIATTLGVLEGRKKELEAEKRKVDESIQTLVATFGTDQLQDPMRRALEDRATLDDRKLEIDTRIAEMQAIADAGANGLPAAELSEERAQQIDPEVAELIRLRRGLETQRTGMIAEGIRPGHRQMRQVEAGLSDVNLRIAERIEMLKQQLASGAPDLGGSIEELNSARDLVDRQIKESQQRLAELGKANLDMRDLFADRAEVEGDLRDVEERMTALSTESSTAEEENQYGRISVASNATTPREPTADKRIKMAGAGFVGAGAIPVVAMMGLGLAGRRVRFSDDGILESANSRIVGVLPDLGKSITDRELAEASAFAVHQIRSQLQILYGSNKTAVFAVTSPAPGDGKTSMIIALGLSFAESGDRTLLIDMDLIGRGLSLHFGHPAAVSLAEAAANGEDLSTLVRPTNFDRLSVLPAGFGDEHRISRLSPSVVRRVVESFKDKYDTVLIDSGPILGSIEAGLLAPGVDGMLMVVGRGQLRPLIKRAVDQITAVGGQVIATVFNRASMVELRQSSSSLSVHFSRQASRQAAEQAARVGSHPGSQVGPLAGSLFSARADDDSTTEATP